MLGVSSFLAGRVPEPASLAFRLLSLHVMQRSSFCFPLAERTVLTSSAGRYLKQELQNFSPLVAVEAILMFHEAVLWALLSE